MHLNMPSRRLITSLYCNAFVSRIIIEILSVLLSILTDYLKIKGYYNEDSFPPV